MSTVMIPKSTEALRNEVIELLEQYDKQLNVLNMGVQSKELQSKIQDYRQGLFNVLFTGTFNGGKSTTLNAILRQRVLPTSIKPETPVIIRIVNGLDSQKVLVSYRDGSPDEVMTLDRFQQEFRLDHTNKEKFKKYRYATIERKTPIDTVVFVDSPGLNASEVDDYVAKEYAPQADAVVFMMQATAPLTLSDQAYIAKYYEHKHMDNVFFVINWWNDVQSKDVEETKKRIQDELQRVFEDEQGNFNQTLYDHRVFYVDSRTAECYRTGAKKVVLVGRREIEIELDESDDAGSGIPEFEKELLKFLSSDDKDKASYRSYMRDLAGMYKATLDDVNKRKEAAKLSVEELKKKKKLSVEAVKSLEDTLDGVESAFDDAMNSIMDKVGGAYSQFTLSVANNWDSHFEGVEVDFGFLSAMRIVFQRVFGGGWDFIQSRFGDADETVLKIARDRRFQEIVAPITEAIQEYVEAEGKAMERNILAQSQFAIKNLEKQLEMYGKQLEKLDGNGINLADLVVALAGNSKVDVDQINGMDGKQLSQVLISLFLMHNPDQAIKGLVDGGQSWGTFIRETIVQEVVVEIGLLVVGLLTGWEYFYIIARSVLMLFNIGNVGQNLGQKLLTSAQTKNGVVNGLKNNREKTLHNIESNYQEQITNSRTPMANAITGQLNQEKTHLQALIDQMEAKSYDHAAESKKMDDVLAELRTIFNKLRDLLGNKRFTEQQILAFAVEKSDEK